MPGSALSISAGAATSPPLWAHQLEAYKTFQRYVGRPKTDASALVSMPTGTGKTAVIGALAAEAGSAGADVLILTPWKGLARQLREDLQGRLWSNLGIPKPARLGTVRAIPSAKDLLEALSAEHTERRVWVGTIAMMMTVWDLLDRDAVKMREAFKTVAFAVVDECQYEPSEFWSQAIRAAGMKTCLLTATAFRNDNRYFRIDNESTYHYSHADAEDEGFLRSPKFSSLSIGADSGALVASLIQRLADLGVDDADRVLIRCGNDDDIRTLVTLLRDAGETAVGFHHTFGKDDDHLYAQVPSPKERPDARFWLHQNKLIEGFDDPRFRVLVMHEVFGNDRATIQQIGRILRNTTHRVGEPAFVIADDAASLEQTWSKYLDFDGGLDRKSVATFPSLVEELITSQPDSIYWNARFRERLDLKSPEVWRHLRYARSVRVWTPPTAFATGDLDELAKTLVEEWTHANRATFGPLTPAGVPNARVIPYISVRNSPALRTGAFVETRVGFTVLVHHSGHLFISDTEDVTPKCLTERFTRPRAESLHRAIPTGSRVTSVNLVNGDTSPNALRSRSASARDLDSIASEIGESTYSWSSASGQLGGASSETSRYVGTKYGRISDRFPGVESFENYYAWIKTLGVTLTGTDAAAPALGRYAMPSDPPADPRPVHALISVEPGDFTDATDADQRQDLVMEESGGPVDVNGNFVVTINGVQHDAVVQWDPDRARYVIASASIDALPFRSDRDSRRGLLHVVNTEQSLRVATEEGVVYTNGYFWDLAARRDKKDRIFTVLKDRTALASATKEKGTARPRAGWPADGVFGIIERDLVPELFPGDPLLLCTDLGTEIADFVACDDERVALIHAKAGDGSSLSAAAFHEVASQAIKNLHYLTIGNETAPPNGYWTNEWTADGRTNRLRSGKKRVLGVSKTPVTGGDYWEYINDRIQSHAVEREVWVVAGGSLSKNALAEEMGKAKPQPQAAQAYVLLTGLWTAAQQCGVRLRVFCSP